MAMEQFTECMKSSFMLLYFLLLKGKFMRNIILTVLLSFSVSAVTADAANMFEFPDGQTVGLISNGDITMLSESVSIVPSDGYFQRGSYYRLPMMQVSCEFLLLNNTDRKRNIIVGFPVDDRFGDLYRIIDPSDDSSLGWENGTAGSPILEEEFPADLDFRTFINDEEVPVYYRYCAGTAIEELGRAPIAAVWKMRFGAGDTITLRNTYNSSWDYYGYDGMETLSINYILTTGSTWSGTIGDAVIVLEIPEEFPSEALSDSLYTYWEWTGSPVVTEHSITWHYSDFEPEENICFSVKCDYVIDHICHCDGISAQAAYDSITWTEEELLRTATPIIRNGIGYTPGTSFIIPVIEAIPYILCGQNPPDEAVKCYFNSFDREHPELMTPEMTGRLEIVSAVEESLIENESLVREARYIEFLPFFCSNRNWEEDVLLRYAADQETQIRFLDLLEYHEAAVTGEFIDDPYIRAFYELTGWYIQGSRARGDYFPKQVVHQYRDNIQ